MIVFAEHRNLAVLFATALLALALGCGSRDPAGEHAFAGTYARVLRARAGAPDSVTAARRVDSVFATSGMTREAMFAQLKRYERDPEQYRRVLALIEDSLRAAQR